MAEEFIAEKFILFDPHRACERKPSNLIGSHAKKKASPPPFVDELDRSIAVDTDLALARCEEVMPQLALQMSLENQHSGAPIGDSADSSIFNLPASLLSSSVLHRL